jgi:hypothetical protein
MSSKCPDHPGTLKYALDKLQLSTETKLVSFLNTIKTFDYPNCSDFQYIDAGAKLNPVAIAESLNEIHEPKVSLTMRP